jgi:hypothetical protein
VDHLGPAELVETLDAHGPDATRPARR